MNAVLVTALCVAAALASAMLRRDRPEIALAVGVAAGVVATVKLLGDLTGAVTAFRELSGDLSLSRYFTPVLKGAGICLIAEFGMDVCEDAGEKALKGRIGLAARCVTAVMAVPILTEIATCLRQLLA